MKKNELNQQIESEIKNMIKDISCYSCRGEQISIVSDISVNLNNNFAENMAEMVEFNGCAEFGFLVPSIKGEKPDIQYAHYNFKGHATICNFKVVKVEMPIFINK